MPMFESQAGTAMSRLLQRRGAQRQGPRLQGETPHEPVEPFEPDRDDLERLEPSDEELYEVEQDEDTGW